MFKEEHRPGGSLLKLLCLVVVIEISPLNNLVCASDPLSPLWPDTNTESFLDEIDFGLRKIEFAPGEQAFPDVSQPQAVAPQSANPEQERLPIIDAQGVVPAIEAAETGTEDSSPVRQVAAGTIAPAGWQGGISQPSLVLVSHPQLVATAESPDGVQTAFHQPQSLNAPAGARSLSLGDDLLARPSPKWIADVESASSRAKTRQDFSKIIEVCYEAVADRPQQEVSQYVTHLASWAYNRRGLAAEFEGDYISALADFHEAVRLNPTSWRAIHNRGVGRAAQRRWPAAEADLNRAIELNPDSAVAYRNRGEILLAMDRVNEAFRDYARAIELAPDDPQMWHVRARAYYRLGRPQDAVRDFNESLKLQPFNPSVHVDRGNLYADLGYYGQALRDFRAALMLDASFAPAYQASAWLLATCPDARYRHIDKAVLAARRAIEMGGQDDPLYVDTLAASYAIASRFDAAIQTQTRAVELAKAEGLDVRPFERRKELYEQGRPFRSGDSRLAREHRARMQ